jgi:threonine dehydrogenase-like Zn-dependent dehydrogenase
VPFADVNLLHLPPVSQLPEEKALLLSDILPTAWYATENGQVGKGDFVAIWGAGPVGLLVAHCSLHRGARRVVMIDNIPHRLEFAKQALDSDRVETIDFSTGKETVYERLMELSKNEPARAPDVCIDAVGMHYAHTLTHKTELALNLEQDSPEVINDIIKCVRKGGRLSIIGAYAGMANHVNIGALMEKGLNLRTGAIPIQKYWNELLGKVVKGDLDPSIIITHQVSLKDAPQAYADFDNKKPGMVKVMFKMA